MPDAPQQKEVNAIEIAKMATQEIDHYRKRQNASTVYFVAFCLALSATFLNNGIKVGPLLRSGLAVGVAAFAVLVIHGLRVSALRGRHAKLVRQVLLRGVGLPESVQLPQGQQMEFSLDAVRSVYEGNTEPNKGIRTTVIYYFIVAVFAIAAIGSVLLGSP